MIQFDRRVLLIVQNASFFESARIWKKVSSLMNAGYSISIIGPENFFASGKPGLHETGGKNITFLPYGFTFSTSETGGDLFKNIRLLLWQFMLAWKLFFTRGFDVMHLCNGPGSVFLIGRFFRFFFHKKILVDFSVSVPLQYASGTRQRSPRLGIAWLEKQLLKTADIVIAANDSLAQIAAARSGHIFETVSVVRPAPFSLGDVAKKASPSIKPAKCRVICSVSENQPVQASLLEIIRLIHHDKLRNDIEFIVSGDEFTLSALKKQASIVGVADLIIFAREEDAAAFIRKAAICIYPCDAGKWSEAATPGLLLEALALGKPSVQYEGAEGCFTSGESSLYAPHGNPESFAQHILRLADDSDLRSRLGEAARTRFEQLFTWRLQVPKLLAAYEKLFRGMQDLPILKPHAPPDLPGG